MEEPWINMYKPSNKNLVYNKDFNNRVKNLNKILKTNLDLNIQINGCEGCGKSTILKYLLKGISVNLDKIYYKNYCEKEFVFIYENVYLFDFNYINPKKLKEIFDLITEISKRKLLQYPTKIIILENFFNDKDMVYYLKNMFEKNYDHTKFIIISKYKI